MAAALTQKALWVSHLLEGGGVRTVCSEYRYIGTNEGRRPSQPVGQIRQL